MASRRRGDADAGEAADHEGVDRHLLRGEDAGCRAVSEQADDGSEQLAAEHVEQQDDGDEAEGRYRDPAFDLVPAVDEVPGCERRDVFRPGGRVSSV